MIKVHQAGANPRRQRENDGRRVAAWIGQQRRLLNSIGVQFGQAVNCRIVELRRALGKPVYDAVLRLLQPPCTAEVNHTKPLVDGLRHDIARELVRGGKKNDVHAGFLHLLPREALQRKAAVAAKLRIDIAQVAALATLSVAPEEHWLLYARVAGEQAHQFESGIAGSAEDSGLDTSIHFYAR